MGNMAMWKRISLSIACGFVAACGGGSAGTDPSSPSANSPPQIVGLPVAVAQVGQAYEFVPSASDADGDTLTFQIENRPEWATFSPITGKLEGTPTATALPTYQRVRISVSDGKSVSELPAFDLTVQGLPPTNTAPMIGGTPAGSVVAGHSYEFIPQVSDPDGQTLVFSVTGRPSWAQFDAVTGRLWGTPAAGDVGTHSGIAISVSDGVAQTALPAFAIAVTAGTTPGPTNRTPVITGTPAAAVAAGQAYSFLPTATDPDGQALTFSISNRPAWANFNTATGLLSGTPGAANVGTHANMVITVSDGAASASLPAFSISVIASNNPPVISGAPPTTVEAGQAYAFLPSATDPDGQALTYSVANRPSWASFNTSTGRLSGIPTAAQAGSYINVSISVSDGAAQASLPPFTIVVSAPNQPPVISGSPATSVNVGQAYAFTPTASDPEGQPLTFSVANRPSWASFNTSTGRLSGTPAAANAGSYAGIVISVSDGSASTSLPSFTLAVQAAANQPPVISGTPATSVTVGQAYSFTPTASDPDGQALTFSIANMPSWASFNTATGRLSGTPAAGNVGSYAGIIISVSDGTASAALPSFTLTVQAAANQPPVISGTPATSVTVGQAYSFTPTASDPEGQALTFSIANMPSWASFNTATGRLNGTPAAGNVGSYAGIVISVSDGTASAALPSFTLVVQQVQLGSATIRWTPPTEDTTGAPLTDLRGYRILYSTNSSNLNQILELPNPGLTSGVVQDLGPGTWYFAVKAYTTSGAESARSNIASKTIR